jgi:hypothetical protein
MSKKKKPAPYEIPAPEKKPEVTPVKEPSNPIAPPEEPGIAPDEEPSEIPPYEIPPPGEKL